MTVDQLKSQVRAIASRYKDRDERSRRLFVEERAAALHNDREREYQIKRDISSYLGIAYSEVCFCGSGQLGFSARHDRLFRPAISDLDVACINGNTYHTAWADILKATRGFSDLTPFGRNRDREILLLKDQILRRGMINLDFMPISALQREWTKFFGQLSRKHTSAFGLITLAIYISEHAFCWKQDSVLTKIMRN